MFNADMYELGSKRSAIRELFEYGKKRAEEVGVDGVFDFRSAIPTFLHPIA